MEIRAELQAWRLALAHVAASLILPPYSFRRARAMILRLGGVNIAPGVEVGGGTSFSHRNVTIGRGSFIAPGAQLVATGEAPIIVGQGVGIGPRSQIFTPTHEVGPRERRCGVWTSNAVTIEDGAWVGAGALILSGVTVGTGAIVAAGAVVTSDVPPNTFVAGIPGKPVRDLPD